MESSSVCNHSSAWEPDVFNHEYDRTGRHKVLLTPPGYVLSFFPRHFLSYDKTKKTLIEGNGTKETKVPDVQQTSYISQRIIAKIFIRSSTKSLTLRKSCAIHQVEGHKTLFQERKTMKNDLISIHSLD